MDRDPHEILGILPYAAWAEVRTAYLTLARRYHPDGSAPDEPRMAEINAAYDALERDRRMPGSERPPLTPVGPGKPDASSDNPHPGPEPGSLLWRMQTHEDGETASLRSAPEAGSLSARMQTTAQADSPILDFGPYAGHSIAEIARHDPRYLRSISRQSRGLRYRRAIESELGSLT